MSTFAQQYYRGSGPSPAASAPCAPQTSSVPLNQSMASRNSSSRSSPPATLPSLPLHPPRCSAPAYGLPTPLASDYPLHPASTPQLPIYQISAAQYNSLVLQHDKIQLHSEDYEILFPWLHGADVPGSAQAQHFGYDGTGPDSLCPVPRYRGLVTLSASTPRPRKSMSASSVSFSGSSQASPPPMSSTPSTSVSALPQHVRSATSASMTTSFSTDSFSSAYTVESTATASTMSESHERGHFMSGAASSSTSSANMSSSSSLNTTISSSSARTSLNGDCSRPSSICYDEPHQHALLLPDFVGPAGQPSLLRSTLKPADILNDAPCRSTFIPFEAQLNAGINFRNFRLQSLKLASVSDIVVYSEDPQGGHAGESIELAKKVKQAMIWCEKERRERGEWWVLRYNVYVIMDSFTTIEKEFPHLVQVDSSGFVKSYECSTLADKEHEEMRKLTSATKIGENVHLGNTFDVPLCEDVMEDDPNSRRSTHNPNMYSVCIDTRDHCEMSDVPALYHRETYLNDLELKYKNLRELAQNRALHASSTANNDAMGCRRGRGGDIWFEGSSDEHSTSSSSDEEDADSSLEDFAESASDFEDFKDASDFSDKENSTLHGYRNSRKQSFRSNVTVTTTVGQKYRVRTSSTGPIKTQFKKSKSLKTAIAEKISKQQQQLASNASKFFSDSATPAPTPRIPTVVAPERDALLDDEDILQVQTDEILHMESLSTCQVFDYHPNAKEILSNAIIEYCVWIRMQARPGLRTSKIARRFWGSSSCYVERFSAQNIATFEHEQRSSNMVNNSAHVTADNARRVLIHSIDGYTDSSVLALAYIMYDRVMTLPKAYLYLQNDLYRSFFVYSADMALLTILEKKILELAGMQGRLRVNDDVPSGLSSLAGLDQEISTASPSAVASAPPSPSKGSAKSYLSRPAFFSRSSSSSSTNSTIRALTPCTSPSKSAAAKLPPVPTAGNVLAAPWFYHDKFDGHFPSRILDFLYLGNLSHATNALMLKELGITHVVSVGENALVPPSRYTNNGAISSRSGGSSSSSSNTAGRMPTNSLWLEHSLGNMKVLDIQGIQDDGVDPILPHIDSALGFIEEARANGGRALVHCRFGVSRSATLVIAYLMRHLSLSLVDAYLMVRARRLNILIQPTLPFMWTLHQFEHELMGVEEEDSRATSDVTVDRGPRLTWPVLCLEIANLNHKYLNC